MEERRIDVLDPFLVEGNILEQHGTTEYYKGPRGRGPTRKLGRAIWINDLRRVEECDMILAWLPFISMGTAIELQHAYRKRKFCQIISPLQHPSFAYVLRHGNQHFKDIIDFEKMKIFRWD